jgi:transcriptional repressor NrdR
MKCPFCLTFENRVIDSRLSRDGTVVRRRRECSGCERRFTTYERVEEVLPMVVKKNGAREVFHRTKVLRGLSRACEKRPVTMEQLETIVEALERELHEAGEAEIPTSYIGERVLESLRGVDDVAYIRFASVYRDFRNIHEFLDELRHLLGPGSQRAPGPEPELEP